MDKYQALYITRLEQWRDRLHESLFVHTAPFDTSIAESDTQVSFQDRKKLKYKPIKTGDTWGKAWSSAWFHLNATVGDSYANKELIAHIDIGSEGLVFDEKGVPQQGITDKSVFMWSIFFKRTMVRIPKKKTGDSISLWIEGASNGLFGIERPEDPSLDESNLHGTYTPKIVHLEYTVFDQELWDFIYDIDILVGMLRALDEKSVRFARVLEGLMNAAAAYADRKENLSKAKKISDALLKQKAVPSALTALSVGHAHIDTAWLWPISETIRKCARTFSSQIDLLERYPDYVFGASSPQHYQYVKEHYPTLYKKIKKFVAEGRWELQGGMWIEADCNIPSGESFIRQFIHGKNFFKDEFGIEVDNLWIPDVFGYSGSLPQIMKKSRVDNFLTQKISWSQFNGFPHHTFIWQGIDGSEVLTHFPPEDTYNSLMAPGSSPYSKGMVKAQEQFIEKGTLDTFMVLYGVGDGGGGPTDEMIERGRRMANLEGVPKVKFGTAKDLFKQLNTYKTTLKKWVGELYLEFHRGTLTTQAKVKWYNRKIEFELQALEKLATMGAVEHYPREQLDAWWKVLLLNQFHDIIPGSSIQKVYEVTNKEYQDILDGIADVRGNIAKQLFKSKKDALVVFNQHSYNTDTVITLPASWKDTEVLDETGNVLMTQGTMLRLHLHQHQMKNLYKGTSKAPVPAPVPEKKKHSNTKVVLENNLIRYEFDSKGKLQKIYDKEIKKTVSKGVGNVLTLYEDRPHAHDAWDIDEYYENCVQSVLEAAQVSKHSQGDVYAEVEFEYRFGDSSLRQEVLLHAHTKALIFNTQVDWKERHSMLRVAFSVDINSTEATYDIQYGYLTRPTHRNTSWDRAKFEVCGHKYADLSDLEYGVSLINDCKYGYKVFENELSLTLLRSPTHPDPVADRGEHAFTFALLPHTGTLIESNVMQVATSINQPARIFEGKVIHTSDGNIALPTIDNNTGISLDVIKRGEKDDAIYLRLVERRGCTATCHIMYDDAKGYVETDMLEWEETSKHTALSKPIVFKPFEIKTIKMLVP